MSFSGKYRMVSQENYEAYMKAMGMPDDLIQKSKDLQSDTEIEEDGNNFKVTITSGPQVLINSFTIGQESEIKTLTGEKIKTVVRRDGNKLKLKLKEAESVTELVDKDMLVTTMNLGNVVYKQVCKRI